MLLKATNPKLLHVLSSWFPLPTFVVYSEELLNKTIVVIKQNFIYKIFLFVENRVRSFCIEIQYIVYRGIAQMFFKQTARKV